MLLESQVSSLLSLFFPRPLLTPLTFQRQGVFQPSILTVERNWSPSSPTSPPQQRHSPGGLGCGPCGRLFGIRRGFLPTLLALERAQQGSLCDRAVLLSQLASLEAFVDGGWRRCIWGSSFTHPSALFFFFLTMSMCCGATSRQVWKLSLHPFYPQSFFWPCWITLILPTPTSKGVLFLCRLLKRGPMLSWTVLWICANLFCEGLQCDLSQGCPPLQKGLLETPKVLKLYPPNFASPKVEVLKSL